MILRRPRSTWRSRFALFPKRVGDVVVWLELGPGEETPSAAVKRRPWSADHETWARNDTWREYALSDGTSAYLLRVTWDKVLDPEVGYVDEIWVMAWPMTAITDSIVNHVNGDVRNDHCSFHRLILFLLLRVCRDRHVYVESPWGPA